MSRIRVIVLALWGWPAAILAQQQAPVSAYAPTLISMEAAVRIALGYNQALRAQRLNLDQSKANEVTAGLKPNPVLGNLVDTIPIFSPKTIRLQTQIYSESLSYTVERGGKRDKRIVVAKDNTDITSKTITDDERQLRFQVVQAFINVLLAKSVLVLAQDDLGNYTQELDLNEARRKAGDLAEGDYLKLSLQKLQFEQDVSAAQLTLIQAKAVLRQLLGYQSGTDNYDVSGTLTHSKHEMQLEDLEKQALANRPDMQAAHSGVTLANDTVALAFGNKVRDWTWATDYTNQNFGINGVGVSLSFELPIHDRNQGEIVRSQAAAKQAVEAESSTQVEVLTDVINAYHGLRTAEEVVALFEGGYLDQSMQSRDISNYAYTRGAATILDVLDAERSYRAIQLTYRQAVAAQMTAAEQVNLAVGSQVIQ